MPKHPRHGPPFAIPGTFRLARRETKGLLPTSLYPQRPRKTKRRTGGSSDSRRFPHEEIPPGADRGSVRVFPLRPPPPHQTPRRGILAGGGETTEGAAPRRGANAPAFSLRDISGNVIESSHF